MRRNIMAETGSQEGLKRKQLGAVLGVLLALDKAIGRLR